MKVYVLSFECDYEFGQVYGVFKTKQAAKDRAEENFKEKQSRFHPPGEIPNMSECGKWESCGGEEYVFRIEKDTCNYLIETFDLEDDKDEQAEAD